ncbi:MAG: arylsulfatase [Planctomycetia bacterium]|nr:arylsulfatase [Planctomycetia bacterium]
MKTPWLPAAIVAVVFAPLFLSTPAHAAEPKRPPNIVFILADDLGPYHLGCFGQKKIRTPHVDRLAAEGMRFTQFYAGAHVCAPSRSTLMTGLHTGHTPVRANGKWRYLYDSDVTTAEVLKSAGYVCGGFGKWGLGEETTEGFPIKQGFSQWFGQYSQVHAHFFYPYFLWHGDTKYALPGNEGKKRGQYAHDEIHAQALAFIKSNKDRPFFCYCAYTLPHVELVVPDDSMRDYAGQFPRFAAKDPRPGYISSDDGYTAYAGMVSRLDRSVGEIMALLKELNLEKNTLVFFASDNGPQTGSPWSDIAIDFFDGNGPLRGGKGQFFEGGIRTPLIARWPGNVPAGTTSEHVGAFWDMMPTFADLAGAKAPPNNDGISFVRELLAVKGQKEHDFLYWEHPTARGLEQAARMGPWKGLRAKQDAPLALYDLSSDPGEEKNVAADHPDVVAKIESLLAAQHSPERDYAPEPRRQGADDYVR